VPPLEVPASTDGSGGDVHAQGNPHILLDPRNIARVEQALAQRLAQLDPAGASIYAEREKAFAAQWADAYTAICARRPLARSLDRGREILVARHPEPRRLHRLRGCSDHAPDRVVDQERCWFSLIQCRLNNQPVVQLMRLLAHSMGRGIAAA
jgi:hypothetical protein